ncbi:T9SS type A sorting domain-containing protein [Winogradskyella ludwigii]|uniref:T9SS type A sorting domain-containing protein n=1 Tax=Winogradskyella ludwigii TaxID=2686076 RepID=UPI0015CB84D9|nr:T9SS type A sorting domain-containing protein [Winogradskyella ludwigii]
MKTKLLLICCLIATSYYSFGQNVNIPDANFKAALVANSNINTNGDSEIQVSEANAYTGGIAVGNQSIQSLVGIEEFTEIVVLQAFGNSLTSVDVSQNTKLTQLLLENNNNLAGQLDLGALTMLTDVKTTSTQLESINMANGNNANVTRFEGSLNFSLTCVQLDPGFSPDFHWQTSNGSVFGYNCFGTCFVTIPDANFKNYLLNNTAINTNGDTEIQCDEAAVYSGAILVSNLSIQDLTGIDRFFNLTELDCSNNQLTNIDLTSNDDLLVLDCSNNQLGSLNLLLNTQLVDLYCNANMLTSLDVSNNINLVQLDVNTNQLSALDVSALTGLNSLICGSNQITNLDVSTNSVLTEIACNDNDLFELNVANGNNTNFSTTVFNATSNSNLDCIKVDDAAYSDSNWTNIDSQTSFDETCSCNITIPDAAFKAYLIGNSNINTNGDSEIQCSEASLYSGGISIGGQSIQDLTGIEAFTEIVALQAFSNALTSVDLSNNTKLTQLLLENNAGLTGQLDLSTMTQLTDFKGNSTQLSEINVANGNNSSFSRFQCVNNSVLTCVQIDSGFTPSVTNGWQIASSSAYSTNCFTLSVQSFEVDKIVLYPNPSISGLNIEMTQDLKQATIYSILGAEVLKTNSKTINTSNLKSGMYIINIEDKTGNVSIKRFIKQ